MAKRGSADKVILLTLVDLLLQLLFLFLFAVLVVSQTALSEKEWKDWGIVSKVIQKFQIDLPTFGPTWQKGQIAIAEKGAGEKAIKTVSDLDEIVTKVGGLDIALKVLREQVSKRGGQDFPSCLPRGVSLATFDVYLDRIELRTPGEEMFGVLKKLNLSYDEVKTLSLRGFQNAFSRITKLESTCRYNVVIFEHSFDIRPRDAVGSAFYHHSIPARNRE
jgi:hypothetical protein